MRSALLVVIALTFAVAAAAQEPVASFSDLPKVVKKGNIVFVQDEKGQRTKGRITDLSEKRLELTTGGAFPRTLTFTSDRVMRMSRLDSRLNGFLIGVGSGAAPGLMLGHGFKQWCINESGSNCDNQYAYWGTFLGLVGGWIGFAIDGAIDGQTLVFRRSTSTAAVRVAPIVGDRATGVRLSLRF